MAEYLDRERAIQKVKNVMATEWFRGNYEAIGPLQRVVDVQLGRMTAADVAPVVHGKWLKPEYEYYVGICSLCGCIPLKPAFRSTPYNYCPNCGAEMDEVSGDE